MLCELYKYKIIIITEDKIDVKTIRKMMITYHMKGKEYFKQDNYFIEIYFSNFSDAYLFITELTRYDNIMIV